MRKSGTIAVRGKDYLEKKPSRDERSTTEGTITTRVEPKQLEEWLAIGTHVVHETIRRAGEEELHRTASALGWSPLAAGLSTGFFIPEGFLMAHLPDELSVWRRSARQAWAQGFWTVRMRAICAGGLIALMVWLLPGPESAGASIIIILTYLVGISGLNHIIRDPPP